MLLDISCKWICMSSASISMVALHASCFRLSRTPIRWGFRHLSTRIEFCDLTLMIKTATSNVVIKTATSNVGAVIPIQDVTWATASN